MKTVRQFINGVLEAGNWDIRDAFDAILARDAEHEAEKAALREIGERCKTVADEAFGPFPVQTSEEALTEIERGIFKLRQLAESPSPPLPAIRDTGRLCGGWGMSDETTVAALFVERGGAYWDLPGVDPWDEARDARLYAGPHPVVAHPPCERWGRYWSGGPSAKVRRTLGDDAGCFAAALEAVRRWGGVLEHPEASHAFKAHGLNKPPRIGGWWPAGDAPSGYVCCVEQGHYGHRARKATWLYAFVSPGTALPQPVRGPSAGERLDEGFHSKAERDAARAAGQRPRKRLSSTENRATPPAFRDLLLSIARSAR
jgi:hypothetical protein